LESNNDNILKLGYIAVVISNASDNKNLGQMVEWDGVQIA
jgi:hypothetical protein